MEADETYAVCSFANEVRYQSAIRLDILGKGSVICVSGYFKPVGSNLLNALILVVLTAS